MNIRLAFCMVAGVVLLVGCASMKNQEPSTGGSPENELLGKTFVVKDGSTVPNIYTFRSMGIRNGFGNGEPICDFIASEGYVAKHGDTMKAGESFTIGKATVVEATDGFGNSGTKLILESAPPKDGLTLYCYGFDRAKMTYWAIGREKTQQAVADYFRIND